MICASHRQIIGTTVMARSSTCGQGRARRSSMPLRVGAGSDPRPRSCLTVRKATAAGHGEGGVGVAYSTTVEPISRCSGDHGAQPARWRWSRSVLERSSPDVDWRNCRRCCHQSVTAKLHGMQSPGQRGHACCGNSRMRSKRRPRRFRWFFVSKTSIGQRLDARLDRRVAPRLATAHRLLIRGHRGTQTGRNGGHPLSKVVDELRIKRCCREVSLSGMSESDVADLIAPPPACGGSSLAFKGPTRDAGGWRSGSSVYRGNPLCHRCAG